MKSLLTSYLLLLTCISQFSVPLRAQEQMPINRAQDVPRFVLPDILSAGAGIGLAFSNLETLRPDQYKSAPTEFVLSGSKTYMASLEGRHVLTGKMNGALSFSLTSIRAEHGTEVTNIPVKNPNINSGAETVPGQLVRYSELEYALVGVYKYYPFAESKGGYYMGYELGYATVRYNHEYTASAPLPQGYVIADKSPVPFNDADNVNISGTKATYSYNTKKTVGIGYTFAAYYSIGFGGGLSLVPFVTTSLRSGLDKGMGSFSAAGGMLLRLQF